MNLLDLGIAVLLGLITLRGYYRGLFQELAVLAGVVGGVVAASHTYLRLAQMMEPYIKEPLWAKVVAFVLVLVAVYWLTRLVAHLLQRLLYHLYLDLLDKLLGAFFAFIKGALLLGFALMLLVLVLPRDSRLLKESRAAPYLTSFAHQALDLLPPDLQKQLQDHLRRWQKREEKQKAADLLGDWV